MNTINSTIMIIFVIVFTFSCVNNKKEVKKMNTTSEKIYYEDIDFINMKGKTIITVDTSNVDAYFEVNKIEDFVEIKSYIKSKSLNKDLKNTLLEETLVFYKKEGGGYYSIDERVNRDNPDEKIKKDILIVNNDLIIIENVYNLNTKKFVSSNLEKIDLINKEIESLKFYKKNIVMSNNINFDKLIQTEKPFSYTKIIITINDFGLSIKQHINKLDEMKIEKYEEKYSGFPDKKINNYWNLYKNFYGDKI